MLVGVAGRGWYQEVGKPAQEILPGTVIHIPANVKHWHGAAKDSWFAHLAFEIPGENSSNEWLEPVTDEAEKIHGLRLICERFLPQHMDAFDQSIARSLSRTAVVRITLTEPPTGKRKQYDKEGVEMKYGRME